MAPGRAPRPIGSPLMYLDYWVSPDGKSILRESLEEPFSYLTGFDAFGRRLEVIDLDGKVLAELRRRPLQEAQRAATIPPLRMRPAMSPGGPMAKACRCCCANLPAAAAPISRARIA